MVGQTNYLIERNQYAMSYHRYNGIANWVSWHLDSGDFGGSGRSSFVQTDTALPSGWYRVSSSDYSGSGYDRGHMTPSGDRTFSSDENRPTFFMTNIIPQAPDNNQGPWNNLENYTRDLVRSGNEAYIISGGHGSKGTLAGGKLRIPAATWKIIVVIPEGSNDAARISTSTRVIAINMPNNQGIRSHDWRNYLTTVDALEQLTGYNFLSNVDPSVQAVIEARVDGQTTPQPTATPAPQPTATSAPQPTATPAPQPTATPAPQPTATSVPSTGCATDLIISEYVEGSSYNKALELFNGTDSTINLSGYTIKLYTNGSSSASTTINLSGSIAAGATWVLAHSSASNSLWSKANATSAALNYNGNDAVVLYRSTTVVDALGDVGYDPGSAGWGSGAVSTTDHTLVRKSSVTNGDTSIYDSFYPQDYWYGYASDYFSNLGSHSSACN